MFEQYDKLEVNVSPEDKKALNEAIGTIKSILKKYPYFKDPKSHFVTAMTRAKNAANDLEIWIRCLPMEDKESEEVE